MGYYRDGLAVYGLCQDAEGAEMTSCYLIVEGEDTREVCCLLYPSHALDPLLPFFCYLHDLMFRWPVLKETPTSWRTSRRVL